MSSSVAIACSQRPACNPRAKADGWVVMVDADEIRRATMSRVQHYPIAVRSEWGLAEPAVQARICR